MNRAVRMQRVAIDDATAATARALRAWCSTTAAADIGAGVTLDLETAESAYLVVSALERNLRIVLSAAHTHPAARLYHNYTFDVVDAAGQAQSAVVIPMLGNDKAEFARPLAAARAAERFPTLRLSHEPPRVSPITE